MKTCCFPCGAIIAGAMYGISIYIFYYNDWIQDEHYFALDFYLGVWSMLLGAHFLYCKYGSQVTNDCWMILVLMGIGYILRGVANKEFSNNGQGEGKLMWAYFIVWPISYLFLTLSIYQFSFHTRKMWCLLHRGFLQPRRCGIFELIASETMIVITFIVILIGSVWSLSSDDIFNNNDNHSSSSEVADPPSVQVVTYGTLFWLVGQMIFWVASASIQGILAREKPPVSVFGMPNSVAATSIVVLQLGTGAFWVTVQVVETQKFLEIFDETFWSILYHFVMVMTAFFIHNLMSTVKVEGDDNSKAESTGTDVLESSSSEHFASSASESVSEGITFESSVGSTFNSLAYDSSIERSDLNLKLGDYRESDSKINELNESVLEDGKETNSTERLNDRSDMPESPVERFVRVGTDLMKALVHKSSNIETDHNSKNLNSVEEAVHQPKHDIEAGTEKGNQFVGDTGDRPDYDHDKLSRAKVSNHKVPKQKRSRRIRPDWIGWFQSIWMVQR